jgi:uncharacterized DUF497 family protein
MVASAPNFKRRNGIKLTPMEFAFDPSKSVANLQKHGIDFLAGQALWDDPALLEIPARTRGEPRFGVPTLRLISVRRSRPEEIRLYEHL